jgi:NAD dependent epimerase/dehydratase
MNAWNIGSVLVTGAGGFIGSHLTEQLVNLGIRVRAFVHYNSRGDRGLLELVAPEVLRNVEIVFGDLRDADAVRRAARDASAIFHLGALIGIPYSYQGPRDVVETNVGGTLNVLEAAREEGVARVLHTSTSEVYGTAQYVPMDERHPVRGQSPYAASKIGADYLAESYQRSFGVPVVTVRPFNTYGPRQSTRAIIPTIIRQALESSVVRLGSLEPTRDLNYVADTVEGFIRIASTPRVEGEVFNLGSGRETSIGELVRTIGMLLGRDLIVERDQGRLRPSDSEVMRLVADASKCAASCNWCPSMTLEDGLRVTIDWLERNVTRYRADVYGV